MLYAGNVHGSHNIATLQARFMHKIFKTKRVSTPFSREVGNSNNAKCYDYENCFYLSKGTQYPGKG